MGTSYGQIVVNVLNNVCSVDGSMVRVFSVGRLKFERKFDKFLRINLELRFKVEFLVSVLEHKVKRILFSGVVKVETIKVVGIYLILKTKHIVIYWIL